MFRRVSEDFPRGSRTEHEELCGTSERGWETFGDFPEGGLYSSNHKGLLPVWRDFLMSFGERGESYRARSVQNGSFWFLRVARGSGGFRGFPESFWVRGAQNSDFRFWREVLGTSRANFEGLRVISEWVLGSIGCEGLKNGPFRFGGFPHGDCVFPLISRKNALWAHCVDYCACVVFVCIRNEGATVERQVGDGGAASGRRWSGK